MNLADAIRKAQADGPVIPPPAPAPVAVNSPIQPEASLDSASVALAPDAPEPPNQAVNSGNVVRLEIFLTAEQMNGMFRAIINGQHSVLTLREAAAYLRVSPKTLQKLADEGDVPGVMIDGNWRFPKPNLDDWIMTQSALNEDQEDVA
ncbi:MAG: helix-turn-helix domain-containing protein [Fimbriimonadaceae bacterium]|jgi:excisionase family DNA binding protein|nr:helix-turn-helix domain-containing protein [Fimbriimonadaceae bacterium]